MKRRFEFRLERVRRVRALEERVARAERARAEAAARAAEERRDRARAQLERSRAELRALLAGALDPRRVLAAQRVQDAELVELRRHVESARTSRTQAERSATLHRARRAAERALEELRERARARHAAELERHDAATLDEIAQRRSEAERRALRLPPARGERECASRSRAEGADQGDDPHRERAP